METRLKDVLGHFGPPTFRPGQKEAIEAVYDAFESGKRFVILECPTGTGKSHIGATFARYFNKAHILTVQKILQDQYTRDFGREMFTMKGRGAYTCLVNKDGKSRTCAVGVCRTDPSVHHEDCPYREALRAAQIASITVHNFDSFYYQAMTRAYEPRPLLLVDEAHNIENKFLNFVGFKVSNKKDRRLVIPEYKTLEKYDEFLKKYKDAIYNNVIKKYEDLLADGFEIFGEDADSLVKGYDEAKRLYTRLNLYFSSRETTEYVFDYKNEEGVQSVEFKPLFVGDFVREKLFFYGKRILLMSATFLDKEIFCKSVGIDPEEAEYISLPSYFPIKNRPIVKDYVGSMSYNNINNTLPQMIDKLSEILEDHEGERGIVHTVSEYVANYIKRNLKDPRLTFRRDYLTVNEMLAVHKNKSDSFIVASGLKEGLDLHGDLSRVQVLMKVPYASLGDKRVKRRMEVDKSWYGYMTALSLIQSVGRSVRSAEDHAVTYILDKDFGRFYGMNNRFLPEYIKEAIIDIYTYYDMTGVEIA